MWSLAPFLAAMAASLPRPSQADACGGVSVLGLRGDELVYAVFAPGGAMDGGLGLHVAPGDTRWGGSGHTDEDYDRAWASVADALAGVALTPVEVECLAPMRSGSVRRLGLSASTLLLAREGRAAVTSPYANARDGWHFGGRMLVVSGEPGGVERRYAVVSGYGTEVIPITLELWARAGEAPRVCEEPGEPALVQTRRTEVRVRSAPDPAATPIGRLDASTVALWTGERSCARHTVLVDGARVEGAWLQVLLVEGAGEVTAEGWVHEALVALQPGRLP